MRSLARCAVRERRIAFETNKSSFVNFSIEISNFLRFLIHKMPSEGCKITRVCETFLDVRLEFFLIKFLFVFMKRKSCRPFDDYRNCGMDRVCF